MRCILLPAIQADLAGSRLGITDVPISAAVPSVTGHPRAASLSVGVIARMVDLCKYFPGFLRNVGKALGFEPAVQVRLHSYLSPRK